MTLLSLRGRPATSCWLALLAVVSLVASPGWAVADPRTFEISAGSAADTLREFGRQAGLQTLFDHKLAKDLHTQAVSGSFEPEDALARMLAGTGLTFERVDARTVAIRSASVGQDASQPGGAASMRQSTQHGTVSEDGRWILEEVIVTAQKRSEALSEVPLSVTVLGGETLERQHAANFQDFIALIPGLSLTSTVSGVSRLTLRGVNTGGVGATTAIYVDEVPFGSSSGLASGEILSGDFDTFDVARIEVLRGPQGTLYGASSLGGLLKYVTNPPSMQGFEARVRTGIESTRDGDLGYSATGVVNVPLTDTLAIRASGFHRFQDGFVDSIGNNPIPSLLDPNTTIIQGTRVADNINDLEVFGGRVSALFEPSGRFSLRLTALTQNIESGAPNNIEADPLTLGSLYGGLTQPQYQSEFTDIEYRIYSSTVDWDIGSANLLSSTSYGTMEQHFRVDLTGLLAQVISLPTLFGGFGRPLGSIFNQVTSTDKLTQELRLSSPQSESLEWLAGAYYTDEKSALDPTDAFAVEPGTDTIAAGIPPLLDGFLRSTYEEYAGFADATWHITPRLDLSFGGRWSRNEQVASQLQDQTVLGGVRVEFNNRRSSESVFTWSVAPRFELSDDTSVYARVASGYRPGGPNILPPLAPSDTPATYDSDTLTSYEVGLKADWFDRTFSLDVAAYYLDWNDVQLAVSFSCVDGSNCGLYIGNGGSAASKGVEFTAATRPLRGLTVTLNGAYTDAYLTEDAGSATMGFDGDPLAYVPEWSLGLSGDYEWAVTGNTTAYVGGTLSFTDDRPGFFTQRTSNGELIEVPGFETIDLRAGLIAGRWSIEAYVRNLDNERGITSISGGDQIGNRPPPTNLGIIRPRTIGLTLGVQF